MIWDGVSHRLHMHCGSADAGAASSAPGKTGGCRRATWGCTIAETCACVACRQTRQRTDRQATAATALETLAMSWDGVSHRLHRHCGSADAGAASSAPGKTGGCRWATWGCTIAETCACGACRQTRQRTDRQATAATALETLAMIWDGVSHRLHMHCGSADAGAASSAPGKTGGCRRATWGCTIAGTRQRKPDGAGRQADCSHGAARHARDGLDGVSHRLHMHCSCTYRRSQQRSWQDRWLPPGHLGLHHRGNVRLWCLQGNPAAHEPATAATALETLAMSWDGVSHRLHVRLRLRRSRRSQQRSWQDRWLPPGHLGLHHRGNVRLWCLQANPAAHSTAGDCGHGARDAGNDLGRGQPSPAQALRLRRRSAGAASSAPGKTGGCRWATWGCTIAGTCTAGKPGSALAGRRLRPRR